MTDHGSTHLSAFARIGVCDRLPMPPAAAVMLDLVLQFHGYLGVLMKLTGNGLGSNDADPQPWSSTRT